jgi:hypothetical protein
MLTALRQGLFDVLPEKLRERRSSLNLAPATARKRPPPGPEVGQLQERQTAPDVSSPLGSSREHSATPSRARTLPSDYLAKLAKRNSLPESISASFQEHLQNPQLMGFHSPSTSSPMSPNYQFTPQLGNAQIPDLKNVMFPSDNPFAYPNPPMSALETDGHYPYSEASMTPNDSKLFGTPSSGTHQIPQQFTGYDFAFQQALGGNADLAQQFAAQGNRDFNAPFTDVLMQNTAGNDMSHLGGLAKTTEPIRMGDMSTAADPDEYWKHMSGALASMGHELPQGIPQNMDYFGSEGWNPAWGEEQFGHHFHSDA